MAISPINYKQNNLEISQNFGDGNYIQSDRFVNYVSPNQQFSFPKSGMVKLSARKINFSPTALGNSTHVYTSPLYSDIIQLSNFFADFGCSYETNEGPVHTITVQIPWDTLSGEDFLISNYVSEQWEIMPTMDHKSLLVAGLIFNPFITPGTAQNLVVLPDLLKVSIQKAYDNKNYSIVPAHVTSSINIDAFIPYAQRTLDYMRGGVESVPSYTQVLKRSAIIDTRNQNKAFQKIIDDEYHRFSRNGTINYLYATNDLITNYEVPQAVASLLLPSYSKLITVNVINSIPYSTYAGWLIKPPMFQFITRNKIQLTQEFIWNEWLEGLYYIRSNPSQFPQVVSSATNPGGLI